jgi:hypothetical protein
MGKRRVRTEIRYVNTDLELRSTADLTAFGATLTQRGFFVMQLTQADDGLWWANFELDNELNDSEPEVTIAAMLDVLEDLPRRLKRDWKACMLREFDIGYDCGDKPWAFSQVLSAELLRRIAAIGASIGITLYPNR